MAENVFFEHADKSRPDVAAIIARNQRIARELISLAAKRHRRKPPEDVFESVVNVFGIACAEIVRDSNSLFGHELATATGQMLKEHIDLMLSHLEDGE